MFKKLLALGLLAIGVFTLSACNPETGPTVEEILDQITEAMDELELPSQTSTDLTLPNTAIHDVVVTWSSSNTDFIANDGTVTIPTKTQGNQTVTLTATLTLEGQNLTKTFSVTVLAATAYTDAELLAQAVASLVLPVTGIVTSNITLPATGANGTTITWSSSDTTVVANDGTVTRPANGDGNASVTLTATVTLNDESGTKEFDLFVAEEDPSNVFASIADLVLSTLGDIIEFEGEVSGIFDGGYFLTDGTNVIGVYNPGSTLDIALGDTVYVKGSFAKYNTLFQFGDVQEEAITATGDGTQPLTPIEITIADLLALDSSDPLIHGKIYTITGMVTLQGDYNNIYLQDGDDQVLIYYYSLEDSLAALEAKEGLTVTIDVIYYTDHSSNGVMMAFQGLEADITVVELGDQEAFDADVLTLEATYMYSNGDNFTLPTVGANGTVFSNWTSSDTAVVADDGTWVAAPATTSEITFTGTATLGTITDTVSFTVDALALMTVAEAVQLDVDKGAYVQGIVTAVLESGYFISDGTGFIGMYNSSHTVSVGDELEIVGGIAAYYTLKQFGSSATVTTLSTGNAVTDTATTTTIADLLAMDLTDITLPGRFFTITGTPELRGQYDNVYIADGDDAVLVYYQSLAASLDALEAKVGTEITVTVFIYTNHSRDGLIVGYQDGEEGIFVDTMTEAEKLSADVAALEAGFPEVALADITLPTLGGNGTTFTAWASDNTAVFGNDGVFVARGAETVTVTFTATATNGAETETVTLEVVVPVVSTIAEILELPQGSYFELNGTVTLEGYYGFFIWDGTDNMFVYEDGLFDEIKPGDDINIVGWLGSYNGLIQANVIEYTVTVADNALPTPIAGTVEGLESRLYQDGQPITLTALVTREGTYNNVYLNGLAGGKVEVYYRSNDEALFNSADATVTITVYPYGNGRVLYWGQEADVVVDADGYTDAEKAQAIADGLDLGVLENVAANLTLPVDFADPVATIAWATSDAAVVAADGTVTIDYTQATMATLTATVTVGAETATREFVVHVIDGSTLTPVDVTTALTGTDGDVVVVTGVVSGFNPYGDPFIQDADGTAIIAEYFDDGGTTVAVGDLIVLVGTLDTDTYYDNRRLVDDAVLIEVTSTGNAVFAITDQTSAIGVQANSLDLANKLYTMDLTVANAPANASANPVIDTYGYVFFNGDGTTYFTMSADTFADYFEDVYIAGDVITMTFIISDVHFNNLRIYPTMLPDLTDAQKLDAVEGALEIPAQATADLTLPTAFADYDATIAWASDNAAIGTDGTVTQPANGAGDVTVTLTASVTINSVTTDLTFTVVVKEEAAPEPLFISEYGEPNGGNCKYVEIYNPTDHDVDLAPYTLNRASNGAIWSAGEVLDITGVLGSGETLVVYRSECLLASDDAQEFANPVFTVGTEGIWVESGWPTWNGDDSIGLFFNATLIDVFGENGVDPGDYWMVGNGNLTDGNTRNSKLIRISTVVEGTTDWAVGAQQWLVWADASDTPDEARNYATVGTHESDLPVEVMPITVAATIAAATDDAVWVEGVVKFILSDGTFLIEDADGTSIYVDDYDATITWGDLTVALGDKVQVAGAKGFYKVPLVDTVTQVVVVSNSNALNDTVTAVTDLATFRTDMTDAGFGKAYSFTDVTIFSISSSYIYFYSSDGTTGGDSKMGIYVSESVDLSFLDVGDVVSFSAILFNASTNPYSGTGSIWRFAVTNVADLTLGNLDFGDSADGVIAVNDQFDVDGNNITITGTLNGGYGAMEQAFYNEEAATADFSVSVDISIDDSVVVTGDTKYGFLLYNSVDEYFEIYIIPNLNGIYMVSMTSGNFVKLWTLEYTFDVGFDFTTANNFEVVKAGATITVFLDDVQVFTYTEAAYETLTMQVAVVGEKTAPIYFENFMFVDDTV